ncbi:hypothetical protein AC579_6280 [Pseudocercospora musae]|uniref:Uncharacterized protein n=1 Tax=Pseudocercospora musae TaxID=113226 RepID=A0A139IPT1_9PEZI|nr:hypothetical protein AC579_6280 [Pseudocercospora musae]
MSPGSLPSGLISLPQELYDEIYNLTFTAEPSVRDLGAVRRQKGNKSSSTCVYYRAHPATPFLGSDSRSLLQVGRRSRAKSAASYYGGENNIFLTRNHAAASSLREGLNVLDLIQEKNGIAERRA